MTFERTTDMATVREILLDARCWRRMVDDSAPAPENFQPKVRDRLVYVLCRYHSRVVALFVLVTNFAEAEIHFCIAPEAWGFERTSRIGREFVEWVWRETSLTRLVGPVPGHNRLALRLAKACGFEVFGTEHNAVVKDGKTYDRLLLEVRRAA